MAVTTLSHDSTDQLLVCLPIGLIEVELNLFQPTPVPRSKSCVQSILAFPPSSLISTRLQLRYEANFIDAIVIMSHSAARTNLSSKDVRISNYKLGEGAFRVCLEGEFVGGNRNGQEAACKRFKPQYRAMEQEYFAKDFEIINRAISVAEKWNSFCEVGKEIQITKGDIQHSNSGIPYLVEPLIRFFAKFTSNGGWIGSGWQAECMEAFSHFSYHDSGGQIIVCDLQGRYRSKPSRKRRFELTDPAISSRQRRFGPTDLGEKGIDSFFANHRCNGFCKAHWIRPRNPSQWFAYSSSTTMLPTQMTTHLCLSSRQTFLRPIYETPPYYDDSDSDDSW